MSAGDRFEQAVEVGVTVHRLTRWCWCDGPTPHQHRPAGGVRLGVLCPIRRVAWTVRRDRRSWSADAPWTVYDPTGKPILYRRDQVTASRRAHEKARWVAIHQAAGR